MRTSLALLLLLAAGPAAAQVQARDDGARLEKIAGGVYAILHDNATDEWPHGNTGVIVGDDGVVVIDSTYLPSRARADIALILKVTTLPVTYLVNTHWHFDHNNGAVAYREAFPKVVIVAERETARWIELNQTYWARMSTAPGGKRRASLAELEATLPSLAGEERRRVATTVKQRKNELAELGSLKVIEPDHVFDGLHILTVGGRRIELRNRGRANTPADVTVYLPREKILFTGDILVHDPLPYVGASWPVSWVHVLRELEATPIAAMIPGHGPVMRDHAYTRRVRELFEAALAGVEKMAREGRTLEQVQEELLLEEPRKGYAPWLEAPAEDWSYVRKTLIERCWRGLRGQG